MRGDCAHVLCSLRCSIIEWVVHGVVKGPGDEPRSNFFYNYKFTDKVVDIPEAEAVVVLLVAGGPGSTKVSSTSLYVALSSSRILTRVWKLAGFSSTLLVRSCTALSTASWLGFLRCSCCSSVIRSLVTRSAQIGIMLFFKTLISLLVAFRMAQYSGLFRVPNELHVLEIVTFE